MGGWRIRKCSYNHTKNNKFKKKGKGFKTNCYESQLQAEVYFIIAFESSLYITKYYNIVAQFFYIIVDVQK